MHQKPNLPWAIFCATAKVSSLSLKRLVRLRHDPVLLSGCTLMQRSDAPHSDNKRPFKVTAHPFFCIIKWHAQLFSPEPGAEAWPPPPAPSPSASSALEPAGLQELPPREESRPPFSQAGPRAPGLPLSTPFTSQSCHAGRGIAGGSDSFSSASPTPPFMLDRVKAPGCCRQRGRKIK